MSPVAQVELDAGQLARARARPASIPAERSTPTTWIPLAAIGTAIRPVPTPSSSTGPPERTRLVDVERHVLDDAARPRVVEARDLVVGGHVAMLSAMHALRDDARLCGPGARAAACASASGPAPGPFDPALRIEGGTLDSVAAVDWDRVRDGSTRRDRRRAQRRTSSTTRACATSAASRELAQALRGVRDRESGMLLNGIRARLEAAVDERVTRAAAARARARCRGAAST